MEMRLSLVSIVSKCVKEEELGARCERHDILRICFTGLNSTQRNKIKILLRWVVEYAII